MISLNQELQIAMKAEQPALALRDAIKKDLDAGRDREALVSDLLQLRAQASDREEDVILEVLDFLYGWARPDLKL